MRLLVRCGGRQPFLIGKFLKRYLRGMRTNRFWPALLLLLLIAACGKDKGTPKPPPPVTQASFSLNTLKVNGVYNGYTYKGLGAKPVVKISFTAALDPT